MSGKNSAARVKDVLTEHISRDIKNLQSQYSSMSEVVDMVTNSNSHAQALCEHLDHVLLHGIRECERGYWPFVSYFTRSEAIQSIKNLSNVTTDLGRGRAWLYVALNEQAMESYIRMFIENQDVAQDYYLRESFVRDCERLLVVQTLVSGLDFIHFELNVDSDYLDHSATAPSSHMGIFRASEFTPDIEPSFISSMTPEAKLKLEQEKQLEKQSSVEAPSSGEKTSFSLPGILGSVFKGNDAAQKQAAPTDHALPPAPIVAGPAPHEISATAAQPVSTNGTSDNRPAHVIQKQASVEASSSEKSSFSLPGILGSVFKGGNAAKKQATPTDHALPPAPVVAGPAPHEVSTTTSTDQPTATNGTSEKPKQASVGAPSSEKSSFSLPGILGSVFKGSPKRATPTDSAHPPGPIVAGPAPHEVSTSTNNGTQEEQVSMVDPDVRRSSSEEPSQLHRTKFQEPVPDPEVKPRSDSPASQIPVLTNQADKTKSKATRDKKEEEGDDDMVVEGKSSRSKKAKAKRKKKKKKTSATPSSEGDGESSLTTEQAISAFAASLQVEDEERASKTTPTFATPPPAVVEREEEKKASRRSSATTTATTVNNTTASTGAAVATEREEEAPMSLDDFVDSFGTGGVKAAQPMPARNDSQGELGKITATESGTQPRSLADEFHNIGGLTESMDARKSAHDSREPLEPFSSSKPGSVKGSKRNSLAVEDKSSLLLDDIGASAEYDEREGKSGEGEHWQRRDSDHDLLSPEFVHRDLLSEALDELDRAGGVGGGGVMGGATEEREEEAWQQGRERSSPSEKEIVENSSPHSDRQRGYGDSSSPTQPASMDDSNHQDQFEQREKPLSEKHHLAAHKTGNSSPESRNSPISKERSDQTATSPLQSSSDTTIGARKGSSPNLLTSSWSTGQYNKLKSLSKKAGSGLKLPKFNRQSSAQERGGPQHRKGKDVEKLVNEFDIIELPKPRPAPEAPPPTEPHKYSSPPQRSNEITARDKQAADIPVDENMRLVFSLDVYFNTSEDVIRLVQVATPTGLGQQSIVFVLITNEALYILRKDGTEGMFSKQLAIKYSSFDHIVIGLGGQSLILVYHQPSTPDFSGAGRDRLPHKFILITGNEAVSRSLFHSVREAASKCPGFMRPIPLNRDDESRNEAIDKELVTKLGSNTSFEIVRYCLVHWEQLSGEAPLLSPTKTNETGTMSGNLLVKSTNVLGITSWKPGFFELKNGCLYQFNSDSDRVAKNIYHLGNCGGCTRVGGESKPFTFTIRGEDNLVLSAANEEELTQWIQALCLAAVESKMVDSPTHSRKTYSFCAILLTKNKIHVLHEDWSDESVQLVTCCEITDVNKVGVDSSLPYYCTISYDSNDREMQGEWLVCFNSELELGKFEAALAATWREEFQIDLEFCEVTDGIVRHRAHRAVELLQSTKHRSDSVTRGRTEFTYSVNF